MRGARAAEPAARAAALREALALWRGDALIDVAYESFAASEVNRLEELRLVAREELIDAELDLGAHDAARPRARGARRRESAARAAVGAADARALPHRAAGRRVAGATRTRGARSSPSWASSRARSSSSCTARSSARRSTAPEARRARGRRGRASATLRPRCSRGRVVPVLGEDADALAAQLAERFEYPRDEPAELTRVSQYAADERGYGPLYDELRSCRADAAPDGRFTASSRRCRRVLRARGAAAPAARDDELRPRARAGVPRRGRGGRRRLVHRVGPRPRQVLPRRARRDRARDRVPNTYATELSLERRTVILKLHGRLDPSAGARADSFVVTEDDYIDYLARGDVASAVPVGLAAKLRRSHFLFLGYSIRDWNLRLVLGRMWGDEPRRVPVVGRAPEAAARSSASSGGARRRPARDCRSSCTSTALAAYVGVAEEAAGVTVDRCLPLAAPYRGLAPFGDTELDALFFFGRERETEIAVANLLASRLTMLYGPSGVGKSSLLRAGVARRVRELGGTAPSDVARRRGRRVRGVGRRSGARPRRGDRRGGHVAGQASGGTARTGNAARRRRRALDDVLDGSLYLVLDQLEEYFVYHETGGPGTLEHELPEVCCAAAARERARFRCATTRSRSSTPSRRASRTSSRTSCGSTVSTARRRRARDRRADRALERARRRERSGSRSSRQLVDRGARPGGGRGAEPDRDRAAVPAARARAAVERGGRARARGPARATLGGSAARGDRPRRISTARSRCSTTESRTRRRMFDHLVTPSGTKIAHRAPDLAEFAHVPEAEAATMLAGSAGSGSCARSTRARRGDRYEIFHDVLGAAWSAGGADISSQPSARGLAEDSSG